MTKKKEAKMAVVRKPLEDEKECPECGYGIMYMCRFTDGETLMTCDVCSHEEKIKESKECTKAESVMLL
jgi:uncharacterized protein (DUF983 family)